MTSKHSSATKLPVLFYVRRRDDEAVPGVPIPDGLSLEIWKPRGLSIRPAGVGPLPYYVWWVFHTCGVFRNGGYGVALLRYGAEIAHCSLVTPPYFRFPEMSREDVQIGATYTAPHWRGRGLAKAAVHAICAAWSRNPAIWYIVEEENLASIRVIENCGFTLLGRGARTTRMGLRLLGQYRLGQHVGQR
jgi:RimJ/RimL family protein N-acetyltransferase